MILDARINEAVMDSAAETLYCKMWPQQSSGWWLVTRTQLGHTHHPTSDRWQEGGGVKMIVSFFDTPPPLYLLNQLPVC